MTALPRALDSIKAGATAALLMAGAGCWTPPTPAVAPPLPPDFALACEGPAYPSDASLGYLGQCCDHLICRQADVNGICPADDGRFYGSGQCRCGTGGTQGPFSVDATGPFAEQRRNGPCCYVTRSIGCTGRPLRVEDDVRLAAVVLRSDWC